MDYNSICEFLHSLEEEQKIPLVHDVPVIDDGIYTHLKSGRLLTWQGPTPREMKYVIKRRHRLLEMIPPRTVAVRHREKRRRAMDV